jgi:flavodoxin
MAMVIYDSAYGNTKLIAEARGQQSKKSKKKTPLFDKRGFFFSEFFIFPKSAPDEIRTHIDGTGNHNSIR